ncbi:MAG: outer membrane beta-barrel protein [Candidatus Aminicenantes bacterium]|nr:outer membrane beta-barrel protein [Candidatus Aminicenantes bacterium]
MKRSFQFVLMALIVLGGTLLARETTILKVKVRTANVRSGPDAAAAVIAKVGSGTLLEASGHEGPWYRVTANDPQGKAVEGYIHNSVVELLGAEEKAVETPRPAPDREVRAPRPRPAKTFAGGGVKLLAGLSMGNMTFSEALPPELVKTSKMDFMGGLGFESGGMLAFEMDLLYSPGGMVLKSADPAIQGKITFSGAALTLPVLLKVRFLAGTTPYILAGGEVGYLLNQKVVITAPDGTTTEEDISDDVNRLYYGLCFGGGVEMQAGSMDLLLEMRYRLGLSNLIKEPDPGAYAKPTALSFLLGIKF